MLLIQDVTAERAVQRQRAQQERLAALEQLVMGLAYQLNNLLCGIIGYAELLHARGSVPKSAQDELATIARWGHRGVQWMHQMLDFSGQSLTRRRPHDLLPILKTITPLLERTLPASIHVVLDSAPDVYQIDTDVAFILQLLTNLTVNARDAMPDGGELRFCLSRLTLHPADPRPFPGMCHGEWVTLTVADTGRGIPPQVQGRIFEPFFTTAAGDHTGLGLAQVYGIVKQHNGFMTVDSAPGRGATFTLYFPSWMAPEDAGVDVTPEELSQGQGQTLLLVDHDPVTREALRLTLQVLHYRVLTAASGQDALALYASYGDAIALVLTSLSPHENDGLTWLKSLWQQASGMKVIVLAEELRTADRYDLLAQGVITCLPKPSNLPMLLQVIRRALEPLP
jgi:nitrogen-specific signal transduction histidine kinase/CheY-like chemotaxis protein